MIPVGWLNAAWMRAAAGEAGRFRRATCDVAGTQAALLAETMHDNHDTVFGRDHSFHRIDGPHEYQRRVPLSSYDNYVDFVRRIGTGDPGVLTAERVELLEPTSGSTGGEKLIPYTAGLRRQFQRAVSVWIHDLFRGRAAVRSGRAYWSISPAFGPIRQSPGGLRIGFDDDTAYLGAIARGVVRRVMAVPADVAGLPDIPTFQYCTLLALLAAEDLSLISVWNPTFLTALLAPLVDWQERLCADLDAGTIHPPVPLQLARPLVRRNPRRAAELRRLFAAGRPLAEMLRQIWPRLALISCWTDAAAARCLPDLRGLFPEIEIQPKGLLATEGIVTVPLLNRAAPVLAVRSHFYEFLEADDRSCRLAHKLDSGGRYRVVITTAGGLYRYCLNDEVEVVGFERQCPLLRFLGKADCVSDLIGEKLAEPHVRAVLDRAFAACGLAPSFGLLVPVDGKPARYRLYLQGPPINMDVALLTTIVNAGLNENPHYVYAVGLGQLAPVDVVVLDPHGEPAWQIYLGRHIQRGMRAGDVKPAALDSLPGWSAEFEKLPPVQRS